MLSRILNCTYILVHIVILAEKVALFWGISYYNEELLQAGENQVGSVTTQILLEKDSESFTLSNGWALPRRIYFNGENCEMPLPDTFPMLPNAASCSLKPVNNCFFILQILFFLTFTSRLIKLLGLDKQLSKFCLSLQNYIVNFQPHFLIHNPLSFWLLNFDFVFRNERLKLYMFANSTDEFFLCKTIGFVQVVLLVKNCSCVSTSTNNLLGMNRLVKK